MSTIRIEGVVEVSRVLGTAAILSSKTDLPASLVRRAIPAGIPSQSLLIEGEDARLNGMTRSLQRRLIGLNVPSAEFSADTNPLPKKAA